MDDAKLKQILKAVLNRDLLLDLDDAVKARALSAHAMIRDYAELDARRSRQVEGRVRFPMQEQSFQRVCLEHGGIELTMDVLPGTDLKVYQPFMRFTNGAAEHGVILGFAAMPDPSTLPTKNLSRGAAATLNYHLQERLDLDGRGPRVGDVYVMFLAARDREHAGMVKEVAIGVVDSAYQEFVLYEDVETFIASYSDEARLIRASEAEDLALTLRKTPKTFQPPEDQGVDRDDKKSKK